jgi:uncharacterized membrane protein
MEKEKKDLLFFGYGLGLIAFVFATGGLIKHGLQIAPIVLFTCSVVFITVTTLHWPSLRPGYRGWMKVAHLIGSVVTTLILSVVFFLLFAPIGIFFRLIGKDFLERKIDRKALSYWHQRPSMAFQKERYEQQF